MITYVNTVLVGTGVGTIASAFDSATAGQYIVVDEEGNVLDATSAADAKAIKVGLVTNKQAKIKGSQTTPIVKWSNIIKKDDIKSYNFKTYEADTEDTVTIDFTKATNNA
jgi:hypothetical protein